MSENLSGLKVLVTGGAGFVGSNIVSILLDKGAIVTVLDNLYTGRIELMPEHKNLTFIEGDVEDKDLIFKLLSEFDYVIHAAAKNIIASTKNPFDDFKTNIEGTLNILMGAHKFGVKKIVYTGSASVYGNPSILPISENSGVYTLSPYATSKLAGENYCISFYESYNLPSAIVRYSNVYGTNQDPKNPYCGVVSKFFESAIKNEPIRIHGDGEQTRDFTFVKDTALATIEALINPKSTGGIFNTGSGGEISINDLARKVIEISGSTSEIEYVDKRDIDNIRRRSVNIELIRRTLRWSPSYTIDKGLKETYQWILQNLD
jgi:UDP-glucose 4-epimerase